jgi:MFS family permease
MKLTAINFAIFLCYFAFSVFVNSTFIVIEQSLYEYGEDSGKVAVIQTLENFAYLLVALVLAPFLRSIGYKRLLLPTIAITSILALLMPFGTNLFVPKIFYFFSGLGFALTRLIGYKTIYLLTPNQNHFAGIINFFEGLFLLGALFSLVLLGGALHFDIIHWRKTFFIIGLVGIGATIFLYRTDMAELAENPAMKFKLLDFKEFKKVAQGTFNIFRYTLVWLFLLILFFYTLNETQFYKWFPLFCDQIIKVSKTLTPQLLIPIIFGGFLGRLVASIILLNTNSLTILLVCLLSVMTILFSLTHITQSETFFNVESWTTLPPVIWFLPLLSFFWSPILPTLLVIVLTHTKTTKYTNKTSMLGALLTCLFALQYLAQPLSNYVFKMFSISIAFFVSIIFVMLLFTLVILLVNDLKKSV